MYSFRSKVVVDDDSSTLTANFVLDALAFGEKAGVKAWPCVRMREMSAILRYILFLSSKFCCVSLSICFLVVRLLLTRS